MGGCPSYPLLGDLPPAALIAAVIALTAFGVALINRPVIIRVSAFQAFATQNANVSEC